MSKPDFSREYIYQLIGQYDNAVSFFFKEGSEAYGKYGYFVTGFLKYSKEDREELEKNIEDGIQTYGKIRLKDNSYEKSVKYHVNGTSTSH